MIENSESEKRGENEKEEKPESSRDPLLLIRVIIPLSGAHTLTHTLRGLKGEANLVGYQKMSLLMKGNEGLKGGLVCVLQCVCFLPP